MAAMPRARAYRGLEGLGCRVASYQATIDEAVELLDLFARDPHRYCAPEQVAVDIKVLT